MNSFRIRTNPGESKNIIVTLENDVDVLEIMSLKFSQQEIYTRTCADYGVVIGRISSNRGFGVPNAKVSIFIPLSDEDADDPIISTLYPYRSVSDKNEDGYRYNLLPYKNQHSGHVGTGTFPDKTDVLYREEVLEIYEKYYKYTVKTNNAGDFMIWGVPVGTHTIHVDVDMSDMGCFSVRPYDLMRQGLATIGQFKNTYEFNSSPDMDGLPQIVKFDKVIEVVPFWGNEDLCQVGITRTDFDFSELGISLQPTALFLGSMVTDAGNLSVSKRGKPKKRQGFKCKLETYEGGIEAIRFTGRRYKDKDGNHYPELEYVELDAIDAEGSWMVPLPMNMDYIVTNEFGEEEITNDPNRGVPTSATYRFRIGYDYQHRKIEIGDYLVPNIREFTSRKDGRLNDSDWDTQLSYTFSDDFDDYFRLRNDNGTVKYQNDQIRDLILGKDSGGVPQDYFYKFTYNKVYSVASFHGSHFEGRHRDAFVGIKEILPNQDQDCDGTANKFPVNFGFKNRVNFQLILASILLFFKFIITVVQTKVAEFVGHALWKFGDAIDFSPFRKAAQRIKHAAYRWQESAQIELPLTIFPVCEECGEDIAENAADISPDDLNACLVASGLTIMTASQDFSGLNYFGFLPGSYTQLTPSSADCPDANIPAWSQLGSLHSISQSSGDGTISYRYALAIFPVTGTSQQSAVDYLRPEFKFEADGGNYKIQFENHEALYDFISEADSELINSNTFVTTRGYRYEIYDLAGSKPPSVNPPEYAIEEGCERYDKFYNEKELLHPMRYIWGIDDSHYGSTQVTIDQQNAYAKNQTTDVYPVVPGYPVPVVRYTSYSNEARTLIIRGLDPNLTYNIEILGSRRSKNTETTTYTIGQQSQTVTTDNNNSVFATFTNVIPFGDTIPVDIENGPTNRDGYNYINAFKITQNGPGSGTVTWQVNVYGGFDAFGDTGWNDFSVGTGTNSNMMLSDLKDSSGSGTTISVELTFSLNVASNDVTAPIQPIFFKPQQSDIPASDILAPFTRSNYNIIASVAGTPTAQALPAYKDWSRIGRQTYQRKTKTGFTEIRNGVIIIVPVILGKSNNTKVIKEWYNRNKISTSFCGGVVNHAFIDNWLAGTLYAFKFKYRKGQTSFIDGLINGRKFQYPRELVVYNTKADRFYYRSTPFEVKSKSFVGQTSVFDGRTNKEILRPTTIYDLGPRDEFISEICTDKRVDPNCSVIRDVAATSYQNVEEIIEFAINYRMDISNSKVKLNDFFNRSLARIKLFDGDIVQLESINCEAGIEEFDLESPHYFMYNGELMDPEDQNVETFFKQTVGNNRIYGPTPIDLKLDYNGRLVRLCMNHPDYLGSTSQEVPYYLWDKKGTGFGVGDSQEFKKNLIVASPLQRIYSTTQAYDVVVASGTSINTVSPALNRRLLVVGTGTMNNPLTGQIYVGNGSTWTGPTAYTKTTNYLYPDGTEEYVNYPMNKTHKFIGFGLGGPDAMERFDFVSKEIGDMTLYANAPEGSIFLIVTSGSVDNPQRGQMFVMMANTWTPMGVYEARNDDVFITPTVNNYDGNLQVLSTPYLFYFGLRPGKTAYDRFIKAFGFKGAFRRNNG